MKMKTLLMALGAVAFAAQACAAATCIVSGDTAAIATEGAVSAASEPSTVNAGALSCGTDAIPVEARIFTWAFSETCPYDFSLPGAFFLLL